MGILSSDTAVEMAAEGVSVGVEHHGGGKTHLGVFRVVTREGCAEVLWARKFTGRWFGR